MVVVVEVVIDCGGREKLSGLVGGCLNNRAPLSKVAQATALLSWSSKAKEQQPSKLAVALERSERKKKAVQAWL